MVRDRLLGVPIPVADKSSFVPEAELHEAGIADHDLLQAQQLVEVQRLLARLPDSAAPALDAILSRLLALDGKARPRVVEQQERGRARQHVTRYRCSYGLRARRQVQRDEVVQALRT